MISTDIKAAAKHLRDGNVVAIPTETVYGLAANAWNESAIQKIFFLKQRPLTNPLIVHISAITRLKEVATGIPAKAIMLARKFWPGPLTLVLQKANTIPGIITAGKPTVAVRIPDHPLALELLSSLRFPLAAPSANPFGKISPTSATHVKEYFGDKLDIILDGGACRCGLESTIIGFENGNAVVYRLGSIPIEAIENCIGDVIIKNSGKENIKAPGMLPGHYSPEAPSVVVEDFSRVLQDYEGKKIGLLFFKQAVNIPAGIPHEILSEKGNMEEASRNLYAALHRLDKYRPDLILMEKAPDTGLGKTINDRLNRAAAWHAGINLQNPSIYNLNTHQ